MQTSLNVSPIYRKTSEGKRDRIWMLLMAKITELAAAELWDPYLGILSEPVFRKVGSGLKTP